jgi:peptide/nickel transport system permease protein
MAGYIARRLLLTIPTLVLVALAVFALIRMVPGDPAQLMLGDSADAETLEALRKAMGHDRSLAAQFLHWGGRVLAGDLGLSITSREPVLPLILTRFSVTAQIVVVAVVLSSLIAIPLGMIAAWRQNSGLDLGITAFSTLMVSLPSFWLGLILLLVFGVWLQWLPIVGYVGLAEDPLRSLNFVVLPVLTLVLIEVGVLTRMARAATIDVLGLEYVAHARAKGVSEAGVMVRHVLPNAFAPTLTLIGVVLGNLLGGIAVIETVFTLPGLGRLMVDAIFQRDYPVVQGVMLFIATTYVLVNLAVDLAYPLFDPRVAAEA